MTATHQLYTALDYFFIIFHGCFSLFNLLGWVWRKTRRMHLIASSMTILSWFGLGVFYGWGYCPCTAWHWQVKYTLGETDLPLSYVKYYLDKLSGLTCPPLVVDATVAVFGLSAFGLSCWLNWRDCKNNS